MTTNQPPAARADGPAPLNRYDLCDEIRQGGHYGEEQWTERIMRSCEGGPWVAYADVAAALAEVATLKQENESLEQTARVNSEMADCWRRFTLGFGGHPGCVSPAKAADKYKNILALEAEVATLHQAHHWQPIETAPKDDTPILTYRPAGLVAVAAYFPHANAEWCCTDGVHLLDVTHWMPLPAAPDPAGLARRAARPQPQEVKPND